MSQLIAKKYRRGAVVVEFAFVAPVFFLFIFTMFEFSRMQVMRHTADNAAYEAARMAMLPGATSADAQTEANRLLAIVGARDATVTVTPSVITTDTDQVTVEVQVPMRRNALIIPRFTGQAVMRSRTTLQTERVRSG